jgi:calcium-dependent protein kinase
MVKISVENKKQFTVNTSNLVNQRTGQITKDYTILRPALGKGAFGEVRKAIHKTTGMTRAIKIIDKVHVNKEE